MLYIFLFIFSDLNKIPAFIAKQTSLTCMTGLQGLPSLLISILFEVKAEPSRLL